MEEKVKLYIKTYKEYFNKNDEQKLYKELVNKDDKTLIKIININLINPKKIKIYSILLGLFGIDRLIIKDYKIGILKLITLGLCGFLYVYDVLYLKEKIKKDNYKKIKEAI